MTIVDQNGEAHTAIATSSSELAGEETATVGFTAEGVETIDKFSVQVDGAETAWVAVYVQAGEGVPGDGDLSDEN